MINKEENVYIVPKYLPPKYLLIASEERIPWHKRNLVVTTIITKSMTLINNGTTEIAYDLIRGNEKNATSLPW